MKEGDCVEEISELDAAKMVTFIYGKSLPKVINEVQNKPNKTCTVGDVVAAIKQGIEKNPNILQEKVNQQAPKCQ